jgi:anti-anti-sigma regulatory factor
MSMTLRITKISDGARIVLKLSGRIRARDIDELREQIGGCTSGAVLDLQEVTLVDIEVVRFLGLCGSMGVELAHCSPYIREWVFREQVAGDES